MKINLDCIPCFQRQALKAVRMNISDQKTQEHILKDVMKILLNLDWSKTPPELAHIIHRYIRDKTKVDDPYKKVKKDSNDHALSLLPRLKTIVKESSDPLDTAVRISIAGNIMDFGALTHFNVEDTVNTILKKKFAIHDIQTLRKNILRARDLLFFTDNAGEIVFDKLLLETILDLRKQENKDLRIIVVVKGGPIINDATLDDVKYVGFDQIKSIEYKTISIDDPDTGPERNSPEVKNWIKNFNVTIAKGQGNYESLSECKHIFFMLIAKCGVIASDLGVTEGDIVLTYSGD